MNRKHNHILPLKVSLHIILDPHRNIQPNPPITDSGIVPNQTAVQRRYLLGIIPSGSLDATNVITKATADNQSGNWDIWCTFITHSGITDKFLGRIPEEHKTIIVS